MTNIIEDPLLGPSADWLFLPEGAGEAGKILRQTDWANTTLGAPQHWPVALRALVSVMMGSNQPMFIAWGPERTLLYNSSYAAILDDKHPSAMGCDFLDVWAEIRNDLMPIVEDAYNGKPVHMNDIALKMLRKGRLDEAHFSFSYTPIPNENGQVSGLFCACRETTLEVRAERKAALEREQQRRVLRQLPGFAALLIGKDHCFDYANDAYLSLIGHREVLGRTVAEALPEVVEQGFVRLLDEVFCSGKPHVARATPVILDGEQHFVDFIYHPITDDAENVVGIFAGGYDVTEQELGKARFRAVQASSAAGFMLLDSVRDTDGDLIDFRWADVNDAACRIVGRSTEQFLGKRLLEEMPGNKLDGLFDGYVKVVGTGEPWNTEITYEHDGVSVYLHLSVAKVGDGIAVSFTDLSKRRKAELELQRTLALLKTFTEAVPGVVYAKDRDGKMLIANRGTATLIGKPPEEFIGLTDAEFLDDAKQASQIMENDRRVMSSGEPQQLEELVQLADGTPAYWLSTKAPMHNEAGDVVGLIGSSVDITARKEAEAALESSREELQVLNETLEQRVAEAIAQRERAQEALRQSQKLESMGQLTGGVAHDFNNLLTPIIGSLDLLQRRGGRDEREDRLIGGALQSAERAKTLVQRLLAFARRQPLQSRPVNLKELVEGMTDLIASTLGPRVRVEVDAPKELPPISADPNQLEMAILNLAVNARDAMPEGGILTIAAQAMDMEDAERSALVPGAYVKLSVSDTGVGMDKETAGRAIEPFFSTKGIGQGTGLGLSMAHGLAAQLGGGLNIQSCVGVGTSVELWLPCTNAPIVAEKSIEPKVAKDKSARGCVLLVDDEEIVRGSTAAMLVELGYEVTECESAETALELLDSGFVADIVVTDHLMPGMTGSDLARILQSRGFDDTLIISGYARDEGISRDLHRLTKPFRQSELIAALDEIRS